MAKVRAALIGGVVAMLVVAGCGGGGSKETTTTKARKTTTTGKATSTSRGAPTTTGSGVSSGAKVRVVNAAVQNGAGAEIDVWAGATASGNKPLATVAYGAASQYFNPPKFGTGSQPGPTSATLSFYFHGKTDAASKLVDQSAGIGSGDQQTYLVWYGADNGSGTPVGHVQQIVEAAPAGSPNAANIPKVPDQSALIQVAGAQLGTLPGGTSFDLGLPVGACLPQQAAPGASAGGTGTRNLIGGTGLVDFVTAAGTQQVSLFPSSAGNCAAPPAAGPVDIDPPVGSVTLLVAYGTGPQAVKLLSLPVSY